MQGFNRIIIVFYRSDPTPFLNKKIRIIITGLRVDARLQLYDGAIIKDNVLQTRKMLTNRRRADPVTKQLTIYEDDKTTPALVKNLKAADGTLSTDPVEEDPV